MVLDSLIPAGRECTICGAFKPFTEFRKKARGFNGHAAQCKPCSNAKLDVWRARTRERRLAYNRDYYSSERGREVVKSYKHRTPMQAYAQKLVWTEIQAGRLAKPERCEQCDSDSRIDGHHDDYLQPLIVRWLCRDCHKAWHRANGRGANIDLPVPHMPRPWPDKTERLNTVRSMLSSGSTRKDVAAHLGVTVSRVCQLVIEGRQRGIL